MEDRAGLSPMGTPPRFRSPSVAVSQQEELSCTLVHSPASGMEDFLLVTALDSPLTTGILLLTIHGIGWKSNQAGPVKFQESATQERQGSGVTLCVHICRPQDNLGCHSLGTSTFSFGEGISLARSLPSGLGWPTRELQGATCLCLPSAETATVCHQAWTVYMGSSAGPHACKASA